jgi:spartin
MLTSIDPVEITLPGEGQGNSIAVDNVNDEYLRMARLPAYANSTIVQNAAVASRLIVTGSNFLVNRINTGASTFTEKTKPNPKPMTFSPSTQERIRKINSLTHGAVGLSAATVGQVGRFAQNVGARMTKRDQSKHGSHHGGSSKAGAAEGHSYKPGVLNKSMIAFSTIADGIEQSAKQLLTSGSTAASTVVGHRYGAEAGQVAAQLAGGVKNVGLVYVDATGVSRKAVLKSVAKGMVVGHTADGGQVIVGDGDGGQVPPEMLAQYDSSGSSTYHPAVANQSLPGTGQPGYAARPGEGQVGFGNAAPPGPGSGIGEPLGGQALQGQEGYPREKR